MTHNTRIPKIEAKISRGNPLDDAAIKMAQEHEASRKDIHFFSYFIDHKYKCNSWKPTDLSVFRVAMKNGKNVIFDPYFCGSLKLAKEVLASTRKLAADKKMKCEDFALIGKDGITRITACSKQNKHKKIIVTIDETLTTKEALDLGADMSILENPSFVLFFC